MTKLCRLQDFHSLIRDQIGLLHGPIDNHLDALVTAELLHDVLAVLGREQPLVAAGAAGVGVAAGLLLLPRPRPRVRPGPALGGGGGHLAGHHLGQRPRE